MKSKLDLRSERIRTRLAQLPFRFKLLDDLVADKTIDLRYRSVDGRWGRKWGLTVTGGFNPLVRELYIPVESPLGRWCSGNAAPSALRALNDGDGLVKQLMFLLHDYIHAWTYGVMYEALPERLGLLHRPIDARNYETYLFCQIVSEAAATIGVDYWWLCATDIASTVDLGSMFTSLTTQYHVKREREYGRFFHNGRAPLQVQHVSFFETLARFYCSGEFLGFDGEDIERSPQLHAWLVHEVAYGEMQRRYSREWFTFLQSGKPPLDDEDATRAIGTEEKWRRDLIKLVGQRLWSKVKEGKPELTPRSPRYRFPKKSGTDLRFVNLRDEDELARAAKDPFVRKNQRKRLLSQLLGRRVYSAVSDEMMADLTKLMTLDIYEPIAAYVRDVPRVAAVRDEPQHLFQLE